MNKTFFEKLLESVEQANEIVRGTRPPSRVFQVEGGQVREIGAIENDPQTVLKAPAE